MRNIEGQSSCAVHPAAQERVREIAAGVFQVDVGSIDLAMGPEDIDRWDSLNHLRLITEFENAFSLRLTMQQIQQIHSLADLVGFLSEGNG
jgi:acyl carrier protein